MGLTGEVLSLEGLSIAALGWGNLMEDEAFASSWQGAHSHHQKKERRKDVPGYMPRLKNGKSYGNSNRSDCHTRPSGFLTYPLSRKAMNKGPVSP